MKRTRQYPNKGARAARLFRARSGFVFTVGLEMRPPVFIDRKALLANNPDTEVSIIQPVPDAVKADVAEQFARLDRAVAALDGNGYL